MDKYYIIPIFVPHKGCPHDCIFCNQKKITGIEGDISALDVEEIIKTYLSTINRENSYVEISFFGGSFTGISMDKQNILLSVAKKAKDKGYVDAIRLSTRPDYIDKKILDNLKKYDVDVIELGVQSMVLDVLNASERGHTSKEVIIAAELIKEYNFKLGLQMMIGLPLDNLEKDLYTAKEIIYLKPDFVRIYPSLVIRDTALEELYKRDKYKPLSIDEAVIICKELYKVFTNNDIPIIRLGLQTTEQISLSGDVIGGPFHPAFRELVEGSILNDMLLYIINNFFQNTKEIEISINPRDISKLFADKKRLYNVVLRELEGKIIKVRQNECIKRLDLRVFSVDKEKNMSLYEFIKLEK